MLTPDVLIANAGVTLPGEVGSIERETRDRLYYLLCGGVIDLLEALLPLMKARGQGRTVVISSIAALTPMRKSSLRQRHALRVTPIPFGGTQ